MWRRRICSYWYCNLWKFVWFCNINLGWHKLISSLNQPWSKQRVRRPQQKSASTEESGSQLQWIVDQMTYREFSEPCIAMRDHIKWRITLSKIIHCRYYQIASTGFNWNLQSNCRFRSYNHTHPCYYDLIIKFSRKTETVFQSLNSILSRSWWKNTSIKKQL